MVKLELSASLDPSPLIKLKTCVSLVSESTADKVAIVELAETLSEIVFDERGDLGLELGVYATPETFLVNDKGIIVYKHIGEINENAWNNKFLPLIL